MEIIIFLLVIFIASYFQGTTGFGQGLIAAPLAFVLFDKASALSVLVVIGLVLNLFLVNKVSEPLDTVTLKPIALGSILGLPLGLFIAHFAHLGTLQIIAGSLSITFSLLFVFYHAKLSKNIGYGLLAGGISGFMQTSTTLSGPPVVLVLTAQNVPKRVMRKLLPSYFLALQLISAALFLITGLLSIKGFMIGLAASPMVLLGGYAGNRYAHVLSETAYRLATLGAVFVTGLIAIHNGLNQ